MMHKCYLPIYEEKKSIFFALGRNAMYAACQMLNIRPGDEILTPAFDCDTALQPFRILGCKLIFFRSHPYNFKVDLEDLRNKITPRTKLIHIINHFGMPQPWNEILAFKKEVDIPILEDNAYSLFSKFEGKSFGTFGDFSIFSLRKNLPIAEGGMLRINNTNYSCNLPEKEAAGSCPLYNIFSILSIIKVKLGIYKAPAMLRRFLKKFNPEIEPPPPLYSNPKEGFPEWPLRDKIEKKFSCDYLRAISQLAARELSKFSADDYTDIMNKKRHYYLWLSEKLSDNGGITILWPELPLGAVPYCLSVLIKSNRDMIFNALRKKYDVMTWPTLSNLVLNQLEEFPEVETLGRQLLQINFPADKVRLPGFGAYLDRLVNDMRALVRRYAC